MSLKTARKSFSLKFRKQDVPEKKAQKVRKKIVDKPPGTLDFVGERKTDHILIRKIEYDEKELNECTINNLSELPEITNNGKVVWINIDGIHDPSVIAGFGSHYGIHPLVQEDIMNTSQRPKTDFFSNCISITLKMIRPEDEESNVIVSEQVTLILGDGWLLTFQEQKGDVFELVRDRIRTSRGQVRRRGADYLAYALTDAIVDFYFVALEEFGNRVEALEDSLMDGLEPSEVNEIQNLKREILALRKNIWPVREVVNQVMKTDHELVTQHTVLYMRDLYDHILQIVDTIDQSREIVGGIQDLYLNLQNNKMNDVMKMLGMISTIFLPLTLIAGIYGMNFEYMPELTHTWGYPVSILSMVIIGVSTYIYYKKKKWI